MTKAECAKYAQDCRRAKKNMTYSLWVGNGYVDNNRNTTQGVEDVKTCMLILGGCCYIQYHGGQMEQVLEDAVEISYFFTLKSAKAAVAFLRADGIKGTINILSDNDGDENEIETISPITDTEPEQKEDKAK